MKAKKLDDFDFDNFVIDDGCADLKKENQNNMFKNDFKLYEEENNEKPKIIPFEPV